MREGAQGKTSWRQLGASTQPPTEPGADPADDDPTPTCEVAGTTVAGTDNGTTKRCASAPAAASSIPAAHTTPPAITVLVSQVGFIMFLLSAYSQPGAADVNRRESRPTQNDVVPTRTT